MDDDTTLPPDDDTTVPPDDDTTPVVDDDTTVPPDDDTTVPPDDDSAAGDDDTGIWTGAAELHWLDEEASAVFGLEHWTDDELPLFGDTVALDGDLNGDGVADLLVAAPFSQSDWYDAWTYEYPLFGGYYVFFGPREGLVLAEDADLTFYSESLDYSDPVLGYADLDGDDQSDVYFGFGTGLAVFRGPVAGSGGWVGDADFHIKLGWWVYGASPAGDVDGDGYLDLVVSVWDYALGDDVGTAVYLLRGPFHDDVDVPSSSYPRWVADSPPISASVAGVGDVDGDGYDDFVFTMTSYEEDRGATFLVYGPPSDGDHAFDDVDAIFIGEGIECDSGI